MYSYGAGSPGTYGGLGQMWSAGAIAYAAAQAEKAAKEREAAAAGTSSAADTKIDLSIEETTAMQPALPSRLLPAREQGGVTVGTWGGVPADITSRGPAAVQAYRNGRMAVGSVSLVMTVYGIWQAIRRRKGSFKWWAGGLALGLTGGMVGRAVAGMSGD